MLEGLEINVKNHSETLENKDYRLDSEFHQNPPPDNPAYKYSMIGDILLSSQYGISIKMNEENNGFLIYRMNEIHNMLTDLELLKCADVNKEEAEKYLLSDRDVLFNRTNSQKFVGRTGLHRKLKNNKKIFASYLIRLNPDSKKVLPEYLTAFLNSKTGIWDIKRRARISINQSNVNAEEVKAIRIPLVSREFQYAIKKHFDKAHKKRIDSISVYEEANTSLLSHLKVKDFELDKSNTNSKTFSFSFQTSSRLDAEYYLPKYESYQRFITDYKNGSSKINTACYVKSEKYHPEDNRLYKYIELANISSNGEIMGCTQELGKDLPTRARRQVNAGDVIISSIEGSLESCAVIPEEYDGALCSTGFYVLRSDKINPETLLVLFKSELMQQMLKRNCTGTILTSLNKKDFEKIEIPIIERDIQKVIKGKITESFGLRKQSKGLLESAKRAVEIAIEEDEDAAFAFIEKEVGDLVVV